MIKHKHLDFCISTILGLTLLLGCFATAFAAEDSDADAGKTSQTVTEAEVITDENATKVLLPGDYEVAADKQSQVPQDEDIDNGPYIDENGKDMNHMPVTTRIYVKYSIDGKGRNITPGTFSLRPVDENSPMPAGTVNGAKVVKITKEGRFTFGDMTFTTPGVYEYWVMHDGPKEKGVTRDTATYRIKLAALNSGKCSVMAYRNNAKKKSSLEYVDKVRLFPKTGDIEIDPVVIGMFICAAIACLFFIAAKKREKKQQ